MKIKGVIEDLNKVKKKRKIKKEEEKKQIHKSYLKIKGVI